MRFLHLADVHLDTSFQNRSEGVRERLREASHEAFRGAVDLALREDVHAVLIAGDLFDGDRLSFQTERFLLDELGRLDGAGVTVVYATGNHDPGTSGAGPRGLPWPANVHVVGDATPRRIGIRDREGTLVGHVGAVGHATARETEDLSRLFPSPGGDVPEVALLHTQVHASPGSDHHEPYAPSELGYLQRAGYDYWALGHVHVRQVLGEDPPIVYAGNLQGRNPRETGAKGCYLVDLTQRDAPAISFRPLSTVRWETLAVRGLEDADSLDRLERRVQAAWRAVRAEDPGLPGTQWLVRVVLAGPSPLWSELRSEDDLQTLSTELGELLGALHVDVLADSVHPVVDVSRHRHRTDVLGQTLRLLEAVVRGERTLLDVDAGDLAGLDSDDPEAIAAYVRELAGEMDGDVAARFLGYGSFGS
ncbi:MAG: DNA repair exonuclease [Gemmatimonadota bacterium]|nr:DNA repair exonuclease [Gemmatimonadota bacterium]